MKQRGAVRRVAEGTTTRRPTALIIEGDLPLAEFFSRSLGSAGFDVMVTNSGHDGVMAARRSHFAAIVLDIRLPDLSGVEILQMLSAECNGAHVVVVSGHLTPKVTAEAFKNGAADVLEKPVTDEQLVAAVSISPLVKPGHAVKQVKANRQLVFVPSVADEDQSVADRWATDVVKGCIAGHDSKTLKTWAKRVGTSSTMISERCRILDIRPHDARDLMRALFAMLESVEQRCPPKVLLHIDDGRTLRAFQRRAGPAFQSTRDIDAINRFLDSQGFVAPHNFGVRVLRSLLAKVLSEEVPLCCDYRKVIRSVTPGGVG